jgi:alpha-L-fucosidase
MNGMSHPWEESRGMGGSYGLNRAETLVNYHTGQELILMLADIVSRGGNLLLDIGPAGDGTIPVIMEERLGQIGGWLAINGDAIYGTMPSKTSRQWSEGKIPSTNYNSEFSTAYDIAQLATKPQPGEARLEALFTAKNNTLYAILPNWPGNTFVLKDAPDLHSVTLLGYSEQLKFTRSSRNATIHLPALPDNLRPQPAWVLKLS